MTTISAMPLEILKKTGAMLVANFEICMYLVGKGVSDKHQPRQYRRHGRLRRLHHDLRCTRCIRRRASERRLEHLSRQSRRTGPAFPRRPHALPHGRHRHLLRHGADQRTAPAEDRHRADRRPLHHGRGGRGACLPALLQVRDRGAVPLRHASRCSTRPRTSSSPGMEGSGVEVLLPKSGVATEFDRRRAQVQLKMLKMPQSLAVVSSWFHLPPSQF